jgi:hypothetical protein
MIIIIQKILIFLKNMYRILYTRHCCTEKGQDTMSLKRKKKTNFFLRKAECSHTAGLEIFPRG